MLLILAGLSPAPMLHQDAAICMCPASVDHGPGRGELSWQRPRQTAPRVAGYGQSAVCKRPAPAWRVTCCSSSLSSSWKTLAIRQLALLLSKSPQPLRFLCLGCCQFGGRVVLWQVVFCTRKGRSKVLSLLQGFRAGGTAFCLPPSCTSSATAGFPAWCWDDLSPLPDNTVAVDHRPLLTGYGRLLGF